MLERPYTGWEPESWAEHCHQLLRQRYGEDVIPVPDQSGGDGGLDAFTTTGTAWQFYCCENEPLKPRQRYELQRGKITTDLKKLDTHRDRVQDLLGSISLRHWILLTPKHESADLIAHCSTKSAEVTGWGLPFIGDPFRVSVQSETDFEVESRTLQQAGLTPEDLLTAVRMPDSMADGIAFADATGPLITVMDDKLKVVIPDDQRRAVYRGGLLGAQIAGEDRLEAFKTHVPDIADELQAEFELAKHSMIMAQALGSESGEAARLVTTQSDLASRITSKIPQISESNAELMASAIITRWLQNCSMKFLPADESAQANDA